MWDEFFDVVDACDEDLVFDGLGFGFGCTGIRLEAVDDVVTS